MNWLDIAIVVILAISMFWGLKNGLIKSILSFAGLAAGIILAGRYYTTLAEQLTFTSNENVAKIAAFALILVGVIIITAIVGSLLTRLVSLVSLGWLNKISGAVLGILLGLLFCSALLAIWVKFIGANSTVNESIIAGILLDYFPVILTLLPAEFDNIQSFFR